MDISKTQTKIQSAHWSLDPNSDNLLIELGDIEQSIDNIFKTQIGSDILRPDFGCDWHQYIDYPVDEVPLHIIRELQIATKRWEPRVEIVLVEPSIELHHVILRIQYKLKDGIESSLQSATYNTVVRAALS